MRIDDLIIEPDREDHIARHGVTVEEVEEVVFGKTVVFQVKEGRYLLVGQTEAGRYLGVVLAPRDKGIYALVTARDANQWERRQLRRRTRR